MKKMISLFLASLLLVGCASTPKPEPTPTATSEPTVESTPEIVVTEGYYIILEEGKEFTFEQFIEDELSYNFGTVTALCEYFKSNFEDYNHYRNNNGEIRIVESEYFGPNKSILDPLNEDLSFIVENTLKGCPAEIEIVKNYTE